MSSVHSLPLLVAALACPPSAGPSEAASFVATKIQHMTARRADHSATLLADGSVLIAGGCGRAGCDGAQASAERYDPRSGRFVRVGSMAHPRTSHTATRLDDGRVLVTGGWADGRVTPSAELFDPRSGRFTSAGAMRRPRASHTATLLADGRVLLVGGEQALQSALAAAEVYDPVTGVFTLAGEMAVGRIAHRAERLADGRVLVVGGRQGRERPLASSELFDPAASTFAPGPRLAVPRHKHAMVRLSDGRVLVVAGTDTDAARPRHASTEVYEPQRNAFFAGPALPAPRYKIPNALVALPAGGALLAGGGDDALIIDLRAGRVYEVEGAITGAQSFSSATPLPDGRVLVAGGYDAELTVTSGAWLIEAR